MSSSDLSRLKRKARELGFAGVTVERGADDLSGVHLVRVEDVDDLLSEAIDVAEDELNRNYQLGISAGLERAANLLMERAGELFKGRNDEKAKELRGMADDFFTRAASEHPGPPEPEED